MDSDLAIGQEVFFLGFPYGLGSELGELNDDFPLPFIKRAIVSAMDDSNGSRIFFLTATTTRAFPVDPLSIAGRATAI